MGSSGKVFGIDHIKQLVDKSVLNIKKGNSDLLTLGVVQMLSRYSHFWFWSKAEFTTEGLFLDFASNNINDKIKRIEVNWLNVIHSELNLIYVAA